MHIHMYTHICLYIYAYIYIYIHTPNSDHNNSLHKIWSKGWVAPGTLF